MNKEVVIDDRHQETLPPGIMIQLGSKEKKETNGHATPRLSLHCIPCRSPRNLLQPLPHRHPTRVL